jgi:hypothetical protein
MSVITNECIAAAVSVWHSDLGLREITKLSSASAEASRHFVNTVKLGIAAPTAARGILDEDFRMKSLQRKTDKHCYVASGGLPPEALQHQSCARSQCHYH